ncbi:MAG: hypothetical protein PVJ68_07815 [Candidatus Thiodiazotropha sp.]
MGNNVLSETANTDPQKLFYLKMHMSAGLLILILMITRLVVRFITAKPPPADIGNSLLNKLGVTTHYLFYISSNFDGGQWSCYCKYGWITGDRV